MTVLRHDHDPIADVVSVAIEVLHALFIDDAHILADVGVLIDDRVPDDGFSPMPIFGMPSLPVVLKIFSSS